MKKHKYNIFPEAKDADFARLREDIGKNGYDSTHPIILYQGDILDGWNRQKACDELGVKATYQDFTGTDAEAIDFMMRTNKRRNLNSGQWACIAEEAHELKAAIAEQVEKDRIAKIAKTMEGNTNRLTTGQLAVKASDYIEQMQQKLVTSDANRNVTDTKIAKAFNTNRTYVNQASKIRKAAPEVFEKVKAGKMTMQDANKAVRAIPTDPWRDDEKERARQVKEGLSVVANAEKDKNLIQWAENQGLAVRVDRGSIYGNPFVMGKDGDRDAVCNSYQNHYLPHKPSILDTLPSLKGKVLICHCYPERCHAESLIQ